MAGIDLGSEGGKRRATNSDINMIPFIDLLLVTIAFLLISAVWSTTSQLQAQPQLPPDPKQVNKEIPEKTLHILMTDKEFRLFWKLGDDLDQDIKIPKSDLITKEDKKALSMKIEEEWKVRGSHRDLNDLRSDSCVLHTLDTIPYGEIIKGMDAIYSVVREQKRGEETSTIPVCQVTFAMR